VLGGSRAAAAEPRSVERLRRVVMSKRRSRSQAGSHHQRSATPDHGSAAHQPKGKRIYVQSMKKRLSQSQLRYRELTPIAELSRREGRSKAKTILLTSRSELVDVFAPCGKCRRSSRPLWFFRSTNWGPIFLCSRCKQLARRTGRKDIDVLQRALSGGAFEMNRRRH